MAKRTVAVIDLGSLTARLKIYELGVKKKPKTIESVRKFIKVGIESLKNGGYVMAEQINELCSVLNSFDVKCKEYRVSKVFCVATSAFREAGNRDVVLEQIKVRTGFDVMILDNSSERYFHNLAVKENLKNFEELVQSGTMILDIGAGSAQATVYDKSEFIFSQNMVLGSLRISGMLSDIQKRTSHYEDVLEEFIDQDLDDYHAAEPKGITYKTFIAFGGEMGFIKVLAGKKSNDNIILSKKDFLKVYEYLLKTRPSDLTLNDSIPSHIAPLLLPTAMIIRNMLLYTELEEVYLPSTSLSDGIIFDYAAKTMEFRLTSKPENDIISSARNIARRYKTDIKHIEFVEKTALEIFDASVKYTGLGSRERLLLQLSAIMHEVGKYVTANNHNTAAYELIKYSQLIGINTEDLDIIGLIVKLYPSENPYDDIYYSSLPSSKKVLVSKLTAILRIADALDSSHRQKVDKISVHLQQDDLTVSCTTNNDMSFEEWSFEHRSGLFEEVIGIKPQIKIRRQV